MIDLFEALRLFTIYMGRLVGYHDLVKWWVKFIIGQFCRESRLPFSQITVPFTEKRLQRPESGIKLALKKWNTNSIRKNRSKRTTFSDVPLLGDILLPERPKKSCYIYFPAGLSEKWRQIIFANWSAEGNQLDIPSDQEKSYAWGSKR